MWRGCWLGVMILFGTGAAERIEVGSLGPDELPRFAKCLDERGKAPVDYLVGKFADHEVVILGETHMIRENCGFVAEALAPLYHRADVRCLATEFVRTRLSQEANRLVTGETFDEALAVRIYRQGPWPIWGYRDYIDILQAAWKLNRSLAPEAERLRIVGLDSDWNQYELWYEVKDRRKSFEIRLAREQNMVSAMQAEVFARKCKALVHVGYAHSILCHGVRLGTELYKKHGRRIFQVSLHQRVSTGRDTAPLTTWLESVFAVRDNKPVGFDVLGSPFGDVYDQRALWSRAKRDYRFADMAQGYVFLKPLAELHDVTWTPGFIDDRLFEQAKVLAERLGYVKPGTCADAAALNQAMAERFAGGPYRWGRRRPATR